ncbi:Zinc finger RING-type [Penicillium malachiteum]|uniref:Zinc finger RING-type n=1 Tax=Penicillium malachiteum TaxID=1324776 RepID=UPI0025477CDD|nr:Zinc finger RING-type [Penicillium malachiteum]KAJ5725657.1 Zinc finger RING-type [Penicillium malachiteum]
MGPFIFYLFFVSVLATVTVQPSNNSLDLSAYSNDHFRLVAFGSLNGQTLIPLTKSLLQLNETEKKVNEQLKYLAPKFLNSSPSAFHVSGNLTKVVAEDSVGLNSSSIACIPCDSADYPGPLKAASTINTVDSTTNPPGAIILYSESSTHCNFSSDDAAESTFDSNTTSATISGMSTIQTGVDTTDTNNSNSNGDSPNTAMIILYSITGIITALFLGIIITGAVRAHRHPERYGPRRVAGRVRQSRARGIARAMLDGIPIVKFGDQPGDVEAAKRDVELANAEQDGREHSPSRSEEMADVGDTTRETEQLSMTDGAEQPITAAPGPKADPTPEAGNFSCPICTDDFIKGQDLRVLPCAHQFHPECIDPWLVNVSGTCPLCRIDLNPPKEEDNAEHEGDNAEHNEENAAEEATTPTVDATPHRHSHHRLTNYLNARRMRNATVEERLAALRHVREANQDDVANNVASTPNRNRLSMRLRERFRIRTRRHGIETASPGESGMSTPSVVATTPTIPAPAHITDSTTDVTELPTNSHP